MGNRRTRLAGAVYQLRPGFGGFEASRVPADKTDRLQGQISRTGRFVQVAVHKR